MRLGVKADLLRCLESDLLKNNANNSVPLADAAIFYGAAVVQMLTGTSKTLQKYGERVFCTIHI